MTIGIYRTFFQQQPAVDTSPVGAIIIIRLRKKIEKIKKNNTENFLFLFLEAENNPIFSTLKKIKKKIKKIIKLKKKVKKKIYIY
jgi:hypothetical protein